MGVEGTATVIALRGESDIATLDLVVDALAGVIAEREGDVVVDLAQAAFIDTETLRRYCGRGPLSTAADGT